MLTLSDPLVLIEIDVVEAVVAQAVVIDDEGRAVPMRVVQRHPYRRLELDDGVLDRPAHVVGVDLAAQWDVDGAIGRADGTDMSGGHRCRQASLLGAEDHNEAADREREDEHQDGSGHLFGPVLHPSE